VCVCAYIITRISSSGPRAAAGVQHSARGIPLQYGYTISL